MGISHTLSLLLSGGGLVSSGSTTSTAGSGGGSGTTTGTDVQEEVLDVLALKSLCGVVCQKMEISILNLSHSGSVCTLAKRVVQMGSTSATFAAPMRVWSFSACGIMSESSR